MKNRNENKIDFGSPYFYIHCCQLSSFQNFVSFTCGKNIVVWIIEIYCPDINRWLYPLCRLFRVFEGSIFNFSFHSQIHHFRVFWCSILHFCHDLLIFAPILGYFMSEIWILFLLSCRPTDRPSFLSSLARKTTN